MSWTSHCAIDGVALNNFVNEHTTYRLTGSLGEPRRHKRFINGRALATRDHVRVIRRWAARGSVSKHGAETVLLRYGLTLDDYVQWCEAANTNPTIRGAI